MLGPLKYSHVRINFNKPLVDVSIWVVNNELVMLGPLKYSHVKINFNKPLVDVSIWVVNNELTQ